MNPAYLFLPHHSNNYRAKLLHHPNLLLLLILLVVFGLGINIVKVSMPTVLGVATDISAERLVELTNQERVSNGIAPLTLNNQLSQAAWQKAQDMFSKNYWAHNAPDGRVPWVFITDSGYQYIYAGENLARDFDDSRGVVSAWMESSGHRQNILSSNYQDIGFAVVNGKLNGKETTLVVQLFGTKKEAAVPPIFAAQTKTPPKLSINFKLITRHTSTVIISLLLMILAIDMIVAHQKRLVRLVGHNFDHIIFLGSLLPIVMSKGGAIL